MHGILRAAKGDVMSLISCPECEKEVSSHAPACPGCGVPMSKKSGKLKKGDRIPLSDAEVAVLLSKKRNTSHLLHLVLCIPTVGFWLIMWLLMAVNNNSVNTTIDKQIRKGKKAK